MREIIILARNLAEVSLEDMCTLTEPELNRAQTIIDARVRRDFLAGRLAVRRALAVRLGVPEQELAADFDCPGCLKGNDGGHGRPRYRIRGALAPLSVSFSRSGPWLLLAMAAGPEPEIGVDVEDCASPAFGGPDAIDAVSLTAEEAAQVLRLPAEGPSRAALRAAFWSRKEAVLKATGRGLRVDPAQVGTGTAGRPELTAWPGGTLPRGVGLGDLDAGRLGLPASFAAAWAAAWAEAPGPGVGAAEPGTSVEIVYG